MQVNELLTVPISDLELGGKAVGRHDGRVVFVDRGLPGDQVVVRVTRAKRTFAEARLERVERPSPDRVMPSAVAAAAFRSCGTSASSRSRSG